MIRVLQAVMLAGCAVVLGGAAQQEQVSVPPGADAVSPLSGNPCPRQCLNPVEAVTFASYVGEKAGIAGDFEMPVKNVGKVGTVYFLNSEDDYRDRNCLTVAVPAGIAESMAKSSNQEAVTRFFKGRRIVARGIARQVRIDFLDPARQPTGKYYFQVHVRISSPAQLSVMT